MLYIYFLLYIQHGIYNKGNTDMILKHMKFIYLFIHLFIHLFIYLFTYLFIYLFRHSFKWKITNQTNKNN